MGIESYIADLETGEHVHVQDYKLVDKVGDEDSFGLVTTTPQAIFGQFRAANRTSAGTTSVVTPGVDGSIVITGLILGADKVNAATVTVRFNDDIRQVNLYSGITTDAPINFGVSFDTRIQGWKNARLELVTTGAVNANLSIFYVKTNNGLRYEAWDEKR